jgi:tetratricopeptide (TPR) repeat protein
MFFTVGVILVVLGGLTSIAVLFAAGPRLADVRPKQKPADHETQLKERLLVERLSRSGRVTSERVARWLELRGVGMRGWLERSSRRLRLLAQEHLPKQERAGKVSCDSLLGAAKGALEREAYEEAEESFLACLKLDARHREAYLGLGRLYRARKEYDLAGETLQFLRTLLPQDAEVIVAYAEVLRDRGEMNAAFTEVQAALQHAPRNPRFLDFAVELAIVNSDVKNAKMYLKRLREANPENQKLEDIEKRVEQL